MKLTIIQKESSYLCFKDLKSKDQSCDFICNSTGGWNGWKWSWTPNTAEILDAKSLVICRFTYKLRIFRKTIFDIFILVDNKEFKIKCDSGRSFKDHIYNFSFQNSNYTFHSYKYNYRILYKDRVQVASFDKNHTHFFNKDVFTVLAEDNVFVPLLICFAVFDDLAKGNDSATFTIDSGNLIGTKPTDEMKWRPNKKDKLNSVDT